MLILSYYSHCVLDLQCASEPFYMSDEMAKLTTLSLHAFLLIRTFLSVLRALAQHISLAHKHRKEWLNFKQNTAFIAKQEK